MVTPGEEKTITGYALASIHQLPHYTGFQLGYFLCLYCRNYSTTNQ